MAVCAARRWSPHRLRRSLLDGKKHRKMPFQTVRQPKLFPQVIDITKRRGANFPTSPNTEINRTNRKLNPAVSELNHPSTQSATGFGSGWLWQSDDAGALFLIREFRIFLAKV